jgi:hypothetical protein
MITEPNENALDVIPSSNNISPFITETHQPYTSRLAQTDISYNNNNNNNDDDTHLLHHMCNIPYDGMAAIMKSTNISDALYQLTSENKHKDCNSSSYVHLQTKFPLLNTLSNRRMLNNDNRLISSLLVGTQLPLLQSEENVIKYKTYKRRYNNNNIKQKKNLFYKERYLFDPVLVRNIRNKIERSVVITSARRNTDNNVINSNNSINYDKEVKMKNYFANAENRKYLNKLKQFGKDDYVRNGYKNYKPDLIMNRISKDVAMLKFEQNLKKI